MTSVLLLCRYDRCGASSRVRFFQYVQLLEARGFRITIAPFFDDAYLTALYEGRQAGLRRIAAYYARRLRWLRAVDGYDVVWLEKEALPWSPAWLEGWWLRRVPYVMDLDDAWFHRYGLHDFWIVRALLGDKLERVARRARTVVTGNGYLESWARCTGADEVVRIPTAVEADHYSGQSPPTRETFTIGWIGQPLTAVYLEVVAEALRWVGGDPSARVRVVGADNVRLAGVRVEHRPWSEAHEVAEIEAFDVGIMPLPQTPWEEGKCGYKLIQYMAAARPVVASPVGVNRDLVRHGVNGYLAETTEEWVDALLRLRSDRDLRARMGLAGRRMVEAHYSVSKVVGRLAQVLGRDDGTIGGVQLERNGRVQVDGASRRVSLGGS